MKLLTPLILLTLLSTSQAEPLFNGFDLKGWHVDCPELDADPTKPTPFIVRGGNLVSLGKPGGHLITDAVYENYRLTAEYRFVGEAGNCGVLIHASTPRALYRMFPQSLEVQMQSGEAGDFWCIEEDITVPNMEARRKGPKENWGGKEGQERNIKNLTDDSENPLGEWNTMTIETLGDKVRVWVNGDLVNDGAGCTASKGQIAVQAEGVEVEFRKLELETIEELSPAENRK